MNRSLSDCLEVLVAHVTALQETPPGNERPPAPRPGRLGWLAALAVAALLGSCASPASDGGGSRWRGGRLVGRDRYRRSLDRRLVRHWQRRIDRWDRRPVYRCGRRVDRRERRLRCRRIDGVRGIDRDRRFRRCFRWPGRVGRRGDVWKGRSIWDGRQCRKRRRRQRRQLRARAEHQTRARRVLPGPAVSNTVQTALATQATATLINCGSVEAQGP